MIALTAQASLRSEPLEETIIQGIDMLLPEIKIKSDLSVLPKTDKLAMDIGSQTAPKSENWQ